MKPRINKFRFYLDENFPAPSGMFLKSLGHNVKQVVENKELRSLSDLSQLKIANKEKRIFLALDKDFQHNKILSGLINKGPGVILISSGDPSSKKINKILLKYLKRISERIIKGMVCKLSIDKIEIIEPIDY